MAGRAKENPPGGSLKYMFVYLKIRIFKCSYRILHIRILSTLGVGCFLYDILHTGVTCECELTRVCFIAYSKPKQVEFIKEYYY